MRLFQNRINTLKSKNHRFILRIHWKTEELTVELEWNRLINTMQTETRRREEEKREENKRRRRREEGGRGGRRRGQRWWKEKEKKENPRYMGCCNNIQQKNRRSREAKDGNVDIHKGNI